MERVDWAKRVEEREERHAALHITPCWLRYFGFDLMSYDRT